MSGRILRRAGRGRVTERMGAFRRALFGLSAAARARAFEVRGVLVPATRWTLLVRLP